MNYYRNVKVILALNSPITLAVELLKLIKRVEKRDVVNVNSKKNIKDVLNNRRQLTKLVNCQFLKTKMDKMATNKIMCSSSSKMNLVRENNLQPVPRHIKNFENEEWRSSKMR